MSPIRKPIAPVESTCSEHLSQSRHILNSAAYRTGPIISIISFSALTQGNFFYTLHKEFCKMVILLSSHRSLIKLHK